MSGRRKVTREYKIEVIRPLMEGVKSLTQVSRETCIRRNVLAQWRDEYLEDPEHAFLDCRQFNPGDVRSTIRKRSMKITKKDTGI